MFKYGFFFLAHIFPHSDWIRRDTEYLSVFSPKTEKDGPEKTVHAVHSLAHGTFSSPKTGQGNWNVLSSYKNLITLHVNFYGWLVKVIISKSMKYLRGKFTYGFHPTKNFRANNLLAKHIPSVHLIGIYAYRLAWSRYNLYIPVDVQKTFLRRIRHINILCMFLRALFTLEHWGFDFVIFLSQDS